MLPKNFTLPQKCNLLMLTNKQHSSPIFHNKFINIEGKLFLSVFLIIQIQIFSKVILFHD